MPLIIARTKVSGITNRFQFQDLVQVMKQVFNVILCQPLNRMQVLCLNFSSRHFGRNIP